MTARNEAKAAAEALLRAAELNGGGKSTEESNNNNDKAEAGDPRATDNDEGEVKLNGAKPTVKIYYTSKAKEAAAAAGEPDMFHAALHYARAGKRVFPCHWPVFKNGDVACSCGKPKGRGKGFCSSAGKHPKTSHGFYDATNDEKQIKEWWRRMPKANIGMATGVDNNFLVLDVDPPHGGDVTLVKLEEKYGALPETLRAKTGSGGEHIIFQHVEGLSNCVGAIGDGLDIRTQGGYIVVAPSLHPSGQRYEWKDAGAPPEHAPDWLIEEIKRRGGAEPEQGLGQLDYWMRIAQGVREGERHIVILKLAGLLIGTRRLPPTLSLSLLRSFNAAYCLPPLPQDDVDERFSRIVKRQRLVESRQ